MVEVSDNAVDDDAPLPLSDLQKRVTAKTFQWLQDDEEKKRKEMEEEAEAANASFFGFNDTGCNREEEEKWLRVREWSSSSRTPDGIGGYNVDDSENPLHQQQQLNEDDEEHDTKRIRVRYILSSAGGGHGDDLWAASRYIANLFADAEKCRELLAPVFADGDEQDSSPPKHPLTGLNFIELGAGGGVPSWTAMWCGARVVCTDQSIPDRIRCMAESAERNRQVMSKNTYVDKDVLEHATKVRACPYDWGTSIKEVAAILDETEEEVRFDVVVAADCIYMPHFHDVLLESIHMLLSDRGVALLPFALHGNTKDDNVWGIVDKAKQKSFDVDVLESQQLTPQASGMDKKRGFVHMLRLTKAQPS